jgi:putative ABC transport system substrate-binding protein
MNRRALLGLIGAAALAPRAAGAQIRERIRRISFISTRTGPNEYDAAFREALSQLGHVEGRTIDLDYHWAAEGPAHAEELTAAMVARAPDVIVAATTTAIRAAMRATRTIPIVMAVSADPVGAGLVQSLARPGGNVTGLSLLSTDTGMKRLQLLRELVPAATRIGVLLLDRGASDAAANAPLLGQLRAAAGPLGMELTLAVLRGHDDLANAFATLRHAQIQAVIVQTSAVTLDHRARVTEFAARHGLPAMYETDAFVTAGGLLSYGPSIKALYRRAAEYVDKILKGAAPADLPVEQPTEFRLVINTATARILGIEIAPALLARADEVIE